MRRRAAFLFLVAFAFAARAQDFSEWKVPGAAMVIVKDDRIIDTRVFGVTSVETKTPVTADTLFRLGSTAKTFVAAAVLKLERAGKLKLDQPIGELAPDLPPALRPLTLHQLLTHTAGLRDDAPMNGPLEESALAERIAKWDEDAFFTKPGEVMSYANTGYALIAHVIAKVHGKPFSEAMADLVLRPAGMQYSTFRPLVAMTYPLALGHDGSGVIRPFPENAANYAPGSLFTSANEMGRFLISLLNEDAALLAKMAIPRALIPAQHRHYGYGLFVQDYRDTKLVQHAGGRTGHGSIFMILPKERVAVAILTNRTGITASQIAYDVIDRYAAGEMRSEEPAVETALAKGEAASLAGTYVNNAIARMELAEADGKLVAKFAGKSVAVTKTGRDRYRAEPGAQLDTFVIVRDENGAPRYLAMAAWALKKEN